MKTQNLSIKALACKNVNGLLESDLEGKIEETDLEPVLHK